MALDVKRQFWSPDYIGKARGATKKKEKTCL